MPGAGAGILKKALISYRGKTDALGTATQLKCAALATQPDFDNQEVVILSGNCKGQSRDIEGVTTGGEVDVATAFDHVIASGVSFLILTLKPVIAEVAGIKINTDLIPGIEINTDLIPGIEIITDAIRAITDAEAILEETGGTLTTDGTEQNVYVNEAPSGVYRPVCVKIDFTNQTVTETVVLRTYYRIVPGGGYVQQDPVTYLGVVDPELINVDLEPNRYGIKVTIEKTVGTNRDYDWEALYEVAP